ncbi:MAG: 5-deoxy-glucuronate isomerase [Pseudomonadota bacterium]
MVGLLRRPTGKSGLVHDITPADADWTYVGFGVVDLQPGERHEELTPDVGREILLVVVQGTVDIEVGQFDDAGEHTGGPVFRDVGERSSPFDGGAPHSVYTGTGNAFAIRADTDAVVAMCSAPGKGTHAPYHLAPDAIIPEVRGSGTNTRYINPILMGDDDRVDSLLVTEVITPAGHWSSYPPHRHDEDDPPRITYLEETYYHRLDPAQGFGFQRVFTDDGSLDETMAVHDGDVVLVPRGHHPCGAPHGYRMYYLNVMAGPLRKWKFVNHPDHEWIIAADS